MNRFKQQILHSKKVTLVPSGALLHCCLLLIFIGFHAHTQASTVNQDIQQAIHSYVENMLNSQFEKFELSIQPVDARLKLSPCDDALQLQHRPTNRIHGRLTMKVSCEYPSPWRIHVPIQVQAYDKVVVSVAPIAKGTQLRKADIKTEIRDVSALHNGYFKDAKHVVGFVTKRPVSANQVMTSIFLQPAELIDRGEKVVIQAVGGGLSIRTTGIAMEKGAFGELIRVRNSKTNKVVEGRIIGPGQIQVSL